MRNWMSSALLVIVLAQSGCVSVAARVVGTEEPVVFKGLSIGAEKIGDDREMALARVAYAFDLPLTFLFDIVALPFDLMFAPRDAEPPVHAAEER